MVRWVFIVCMCFLEKGAATVPIVSVSKKLEF